MKFIVLLLATIVAAAPPVDYDRLVVTEEVYPDRFVIYTGKHDIVEIVVPLNKINLSVDPEENIDESKITIFFVEADVEDNGEKDYKGLYVYKNHTVTKVLENGQCATYAKKDIVYFGAKDGIYKYNAMDQTATKYGTVTDSVIRMTVDIKTGHVYYLTEDYVLYKYNKDEIESAKVEAVKDARDLVFDFDGNMFYYDGNNQFYTYNGKRVLKIEGLPAHPTQVDLIRVPVMIHKVFTIIDGRLYQIKADGTSEKARFRFQAKPTAYAPDLLLHEYYAYKQKIYLYKMVDIINAMMHGELSTILEANKEQFNPFNNSKFYIQL